ncbi:hypothetical protein KJ903_02575 [Patescibacteria group bacterium]|nr:hypothetical protein [Patescibacteria group bacterium]
MASQERPVGDVAKDTQGSYEKYGLGDDEDSSGIIKRLEQGELSPELFIKEQDELKGVAGFSQVLEVAGAKLLERVQGDYTQARKFFSLRGYNAEQVDKFRRLKNYEDLLAAGAKLLTDEGEAKLARLYENDDAPVPVGTYFLRATFFDRDGNKKEQRGMVGHIYEPTTQAVLEKKARAEISAMGLHNFGMAVGGEKYPLGQKVDFIITDERGTPVGEPSYVTVDGAGYPVKRNKQEFHPVWLAEIAEHEREKSLTPDERFKEAIYKLVSDLPAEAVKYDNKLSDLLGNGAGNLSIYGWLSLLRGLADNKVMSYLPSDEVAIKKAEKLEDAWKMMRGGVGESAEEAEELVYRVIEKIVG